MKSRPEEGFKTAGEASIVTGSDQHPLPRGLTELVTAQPGREQERGLVESEVSTPSLVEVGSVGSSEISLLGRCGANSFSDSLDLRWGLSVAWDLVGRADFFASEMSAGSSSPEVGGRGGRGGARRVPMAPQDARQSVGRGFFSGPPERVFAAGGSPLAPSDRETWRRGRSASPHSQWKESRALSRSPDHLGGRGRGSHHWPPGGPASSNRRQEGDDIPRAAVGEGMQSGPGEVENVLVSADEWAEFTASFQKMQAVLEARVHGRAADHEGHFAERADLGIGAEEAGRADRYDRPPTPRQGADNWEGGPTIGGRGSGPMRAQHGRAGVGYIPPGRHAEQQRDLPSIRPGFSGAEFSGVRQMSTTERWPTKVIPLQMPLRSPPAFSDAKQVVKLPKFSAAKTATLSEDAEFWLGHLASAIFMNKWTFEQSYVWVRLSLELPASRWFMTRSDHFREHPDGQEAGWHSFWTEFESRFIVRDVYQLRTLFEGRMQRQHETIYSYGDAVLHLAQQLSIDKDSKEVIRQLIKGLSNRSVKKRLSTSRPSSFEQAVSWAIEYELDVAAERKERPDPAPKESLKAEPGTQEKSVKAPTQREKPEAEQTTQTLQQLGKQLDELHKRVTGLGQVVAKSALPPPAPARRPLSEIKCRACNEFGHFARDCPKGDRRPTPGAGRTVHYTDEELEQIHFDEDMEDGTFLLQTVLEDVGLEVHLQDDEMVGRVSVFGLCQEVEGAVRHQGTALASAGLDPMSTWVEVRNGQVRRASQPAGMSTRRYHQVLEELVRAPGGKQALDAYFSGTALSSAYDPLAKPLPGVPYVPYYTAFVKGDIMGHPIDCLVDTGATISVLTVESVVRMNLQDAVQKTNKCFTSASSHSVHSQGELPQLPVSIGGVICLVNFYIAPQGGYEMLLGMDVLMPRKVAIDFNDHSMRLAKKLPDPADDYIPCKKVPLEIRKACKSPLNFLRRCELTESEEWVGFPDCSSNHAQFEQFSTDDLPELVPTLGVLETGEPHLSPYRISLEAAATTSAPLLDEDMLPFGWSTLQRPFLSSRVPQVEGVVPGTLLTGGLQLSELQSLQDDSAHAVPAYAEPGLQAVGADRQEFELSTDEEVEEGSPVGTSEWGSDNMLELLTTDFFDQEFWGSMLRESGEPDFAPEDDTASESTAQSIISDFLSSVGAGFSDEEEHDETAENAAELQEAIPNFQAGPDTVFSAQLPARRIPRRGTQRDRVVFDPRRWRAPASYTPDSEFYTRNGAVRYFLHHQELAVAWGALGDYLEPETLLDLGRLVTARETNHDPGNPVINGAVERVNRMLMEMLVRVRDLDGEPEHWYLERLFREPDESMTLQPKTDWKGGGGAKFYAAFEDAELSEEERWEEDMDFTACQAEWEEWEAYRQRSCFTFLRSESPLEVRMAGINVDFPFEMHFGEQLTAPEKQQAVEVLRRHRAAFEVDPIQLSCTTACEHVIDTGNHRPINIPMYRYSQVEMEVIEAEVQTMLAMGIIQASVSPWSASVVAVLKKDSTWRICVDYRELNKVTKRDTYPMPTVDSMLDLLGSSKVFCLLDLRSAYWQIPLEASSREKTAFSTRSGHWEFVRMPFGLANAPSTFQRCIYQILATLEKRANPYLDDILLHHETVTLCLQILDQTLTKLEEASLVAKGPKCRICVQEMIYLGFKVTAQGILPDPKKVEAIVNLETPKGPSAVKSALGIYVQYRRFMPRFAAEAAVLSDLLKKGQPWVWTKEANRAWEMLKDILTRAPILTRVDFAKPFFLATDWSPRAVGAVLTQRTFTANGDVQGEGVLGYASRKLNDAERNYSATEGECLAVVFGIKFFRPYLYGITFTVETDHIALRWLMNDKDIQGRLARWALKLMCYHFVIVYKKGLHHKTADALSRLEQQDASFYLNLSVTLSSLEAERIPAPVLQMLCCPGMAAEGAGQEETLGKLTESQKNELARWEAYQSKVQGMAVAQVDLQTEYLRILIDPLTLEGGVVLDTAPLACTRETMPGVAAVPAAPRQQGAPVHGDMNRRARSGKGHAQNSPKTTDNRTTEKKKGASFMESSSTEPFPAMAPGQQQHVDRQMQEHRKQAYLESLRKLGAPGKAVNQEVVKQQLEAKKRYLDSLSQASTLRMMTMGGAHSDGELAAEEKEIVMEEDHEDGHFPMDSGEATMRIPFPLPLTDLENLDEGEETSEPVVTTFLGVSPWSLDLSPYPYPDNLPGGVCLQQKCMVCNCDTEHLRCSWCQFFLCSHCLIQESNNPLGYSTTTSWCCCLCQAKKGVDAAEDRVLLHYLRKGLFPLNFQAKWKAKCKARATFYVWDSCRLVLLHRRIKSACWLVIPPVAARHLLVREAHNWGHTGINKLMAALNTTFWWVGMSFIVKKVVKDCHSCQQMKTPIQAPSQLCPTTIPAGPWSVVCMDLITFVRSTGGNRYVIVAQDWFSKWVEVRAIPDKKASTVAVFFKEEILQRVGCPKCVLTDQGTEFRGMLSQVLWICQVKHRVTSPYNPQANGLVERFNRTLVAALKAAMNRSDLSSWEQGLGDFIMSYRGFPHTSTGVSPHKLLRGVDMPLPWEFPPESPISLPDLDPEYLSRYMVEVSRTLEKWHALATESMTKMQAKNRKDYDARQAGGVVFEFKEGDLVYVRTPSSRKNKLSPDFQGPYLLVKFKDQGKHTAMLEIPGKGLRQRTVRMLLPASSLPEVQRLEAQAAKDSDAADLWK